MPYSDPANTRAAMRRYYARHRERILARQRVQRDPKRARQRRREREAWVRAQKGTTCSGCGRTFAPQALSWHHRDPATKRFNPSQANRGQEALLAEMAKCDVLCTACHRQAHPAVDRPRDEQGRFTAWLSENR